MVEAMRNAYAEGEKAKKGTGAFAAFPYAKDAAPYMHPRLSQAAVTGANGSPLIPANRTPVELTDEELAAVIAGRAGGDGTPEPTGGAA